MPAALLAGALVILTTCLQSPPDDESRPDMTSYLRWTINGQAPSENLCSGLSRGAVSVEIWENPGAVEIVDNRYTCNPDPTNENYFVLRFDCTGGACSSTVRLGDSCNEDEDCCPLRRECTGIGFCVEGACTNPEKWGEPCIEEEDCGFCAEGACTNSEKLGRPCIEEEDCCFETKEECEGAGYCAAGEVQAHVFFFSCAADCGPDTPGEACDECVTCIKAELREDLGEEDEEPMAQSGDYVVVFPDNRSQCPVTDLDSILGCMDLNDENILGTLDFSLATHGPLEVGIHWGTGDDGACGDVDYMGYMLVMTHGSDGERLDEEAVVDEMKVDREDLACVEELGWPLVPFGMYRLDIEGKTDTDDMRWKTDEANMCEITIPEDGQDPAVCDVPVIRE